MKKKDFLATLKAMPDCEEKNKLLKSMEEEGVEDDDKDDDTADEKDNEKSLTVGAGGLSKALDELERLQGAGAPAVAPLGARMGEDADVGLAKSMDATGFVKSLVEQVAAHSDDLGAAVAEVSQQQAVNNTAMLATAVLNSNRAPSRRASSWSTSFRYASLTSAVVARVASCLPARRLRCRR